MRKQTGFTLIEIAIVLVIIGLLLGGILKGQELINSAKVKSLAQDFRNIPIFIYGYQDKYRALPGDDPDPVTHVGTTGTLATTPASPAARGNGLIEGNWNSSTATDESFLFWQHVRLAGLATGTPDVTANPYIPRNSEGGILGIQSQPGFTTIDKNAAGTTLKMTGTYVVCSDAILGKYVKQLDVTLDDGNTDAGSMRATNAAAGNKSIATTAIVDSEPYTVCLGF